MITMLVTHPPAAFLPPPASGFVLAGADALLLAPSLVAIAGAMALVFLAARTPSTTRTSHDDDGGARVSQRLAA